MIRKFIVPAMLLCAGVTSAQAEITFMIGEPLDECLGSRTVMQGKGEVGAGWHQNSKMVETSGACNPPGIAIFMQGE